MELRDWLVAIVSFILFAVIVKSQNISSLVKIVSSLFIMLLVSFYYEKRFKLESYYGMVLVRSKKGISLLRNISKALGAYQDILADVSFSLAFGLLSLYLMNWQPMKKRVYSLIIAGFLFVTLSLLYPLAIDYVGNFFPTHTASKNSNSNILLLLITSIGGLLSSMVYLAYLSAFHVLSQLYAHFFLGAVKAQQAVTLILPGINIPFFEGILALAIILIIHEGGHAILTVRHKIPLLNTGLVFFGSLPMGAFVEPDERRLFAKPRKVVARVLSAGPGFNLFSAVLFGMLFLAFLVFTKPFVLHGCYITDGVLKGSIITSINGGDCFTVLQPNSSANITLLNGSTVQLPVDERGKLSIEGYLLSDSANRIYTNGILAFFYHLLGLTFALSLFIGIINLLPVPLFDGDHLLASVIGRGLAHKVITYSLLIAFFILLLPGIF